MKSRVMTASQLSSINQSFDNGIVYHYGVEEKVQEIIKIVDKYNRVLDYGMPTSGTTFIRINTTVKRDQNSAPWAISGGAMVRESISAEVEQSIENTLKLNPEHEIVKQLMTVNIINEWDRYVVVFELYLDLELKGALNATHG